MAFPRMRRDGPDVTADDAGPNAALAPAAVTPSGSGQVTAFGQTSTDVVDYLIAGTKWGGARGTGVTVDYSFATGSSRWAENYGYGEPRDGFAALNPAQKAAVREALTAWSDVANIRFREVTETTVKVGDIRFGLSDVPPTAWSYYPERGLPEGGDVWLGSGYHRGATDYGRGTYLDHTVLHEIGHAIGLKHPHDPDGPGIAASSDWLGVSVMSYRSYKGGPVDDGYTNDFYPYKPMLWDIQGLQAIYGANMATGSGDTVYGWNKGQQLFETIWDGGGHDRIDWSNQSSSASINLQAGSWSELGAPYTFWGSSTRYYETTLAIARGVTIEDAAGGSGSDQIKGNGSANTLWGNGGADLLRGESGYDDLRGGTGNDKLFGGPGRDELSGGNGADALRGGTGVDDLSGGTGRDRFVFDDGETGLGSSRDHILDFSRGQGDVIDLSMIDANRSASGDQAFAWRGAAALKGAAQLGYFHSGSDTILTGSTDRDTSPELQITLEGHLTPNADWFVL